MRLTLRTMLSWLDDTLPPDDVRELGQQVTESPFARELVERIRLVKRQRRLTVPPSTGEDTVDPNTVAEYLDNVMAPEQIPDFERICLRSDVHLAEVASVHEILSLLGQKAKVSDQTRYRMYRALQLETAKVDPFLNDSPFFEVENQGADLKEGPSHSGSDRIRRQIPLLAAILLSGLLGWSTWYNLSTPAQIKPGEESVDLRILAATFAQRSKNPEALILAGNQAVLAQSDSPQANHGSTEAKGLFENAVASEEAMGRHELVDPSNTAEAATTVRVGGKAKIIVTKTNGVLLKRAGPDKAWERLTPGEAGLLDEEIVNLEPFRSELTFGNERFTLVGSSALKVVADQDSPETRFQLESGRLIYSTGKEPGILRILEGTKTVDLFIAGDSRLGLERRTTWTPGSTLELSPLKVFSAQGTVELRSSLGISPLRAGSCTTINQKGEFASVTQEATPSWVTEIDGPIIEQEEARQFLRFFKADQPPLPNLVEASASVRPEIRRLALQGLGSIHHLSLLVNALSAEGQPEIRRAAIEAVRVYLARGGATEKTIFDELKRQADTENWAILAMSLLKGVDPNDASNPKIHAELLNNLDSRDTAIRELALDNLREVTQRADDLGYDPDHPDQAGIRAWRAALLPDANSARRPN